DTGGAHNCIVRRGGTVLCWGAHAEGALGQIFPGDANQPTPVQVPKVAGALRVAGGHVHSCAVLQNGHVMCWGRPSNAGYPLAYPSPGPSVIDEAGASLSNAQRISAADHSCATRSPGTILCWGQNESGQLGGGFANTNSLPVLMKDL